MQGVRFWDKELLSRMNARLLSEKKMRHGVREKVIVSAARATPSCSKRSFVRTLACSEIDMLVTDEPLDKGDEETLEKAGVQVVYA